MKQFLFGSRKYRIFHLLLFFFGCVWLFSRTPVLDDVDRIPTLNAPESTFDNARILRALLVWSRFIKGLYFKLKHL